MISQKGLLVFLIAVLMFFSMALSGCGTQRDPAQLTDDEQIAYYTDRINKSDDAYLYYNRGQAYFRKQQYDLAIADYNRVIELIPDRALAYADRGFFFYESRRYNSALADYNRAIELTPDLPLTYAYRALLYIELGSTAQAIKDWETLINLTDNQQLIEIVRQRIEELTE